MGNNIANLRKMEAEALKGDGRIDAQEAKNLAQAATTDVVAGFEDGASAATELFAHLEAAKVAFLSGDLTQARTDLAKLRTLSPLPLLQTQSLAQDELRALRDSLPDGAREVFDDEVNAAKSGVLKGL